MPTSRGFVSDNCSGVHPELLVAIEAANEGHVPSYGSDRVTRRFEQLVGTEFGPDAVGFPVLNGTGANITALRAVTRPHQGVICTETAHIHVDETASPEAIAGVKLLTVSTEDGKLTPELVSGRMPEALDIPHTASPSVVSITQATEVGTAYSPAEIKALSEISHDNNMLLHMDGARLANAAAAADLSLSEASIGSGVDVLTFGATKNGAMYGEAVIFAVHDLAKGIRMAMESSEAVNNDFNLCRGKGITILELARKIWAKVRPGEELRYVSDTPYPHDVPYRVPDVRKARAVLGFEATTPLNDMLDEVIAWIRDELDAGVLTAETRA